MNSARTLGYMSSGDCPTNWIVCPPCDGLVDASGDAPYTMANITEAPWYDVEHEPTHRFFGVHALSIEGLNDSTRTAQISEGITDGGVVGRVRHAVRQVRVRALLSGNGEDALEAGLDWLKAALDPDSCGTHGNSCGAVDSCFYTACPPERSTFDTGSWVDTPPIEDWVVANTNLATNPSFETQGGAAVTVRTNLFRNPRMTAGGGWANTRSEVPATNLPEGTQFDVVSQVGDWIALHGDMLEDAETGMPFITSVEVEVPVGYPAVQLFWQWEERYDLVQLDPQDIDPNVVSPLAIDGPSVTINPGETKRISTPEGRVLVNTNRGRAILRAGGGVNLPIGARFIVRKMMAEFSSVSRPYFDGSTLNAGDWTYAWTGTTDNSRSIQMGLPVAGLPVAGGSIGTQTSDSPASGSKAIRFTVGHGGALGIGLVANPPDGPTLYTLLGKVRPRNRDQVFKPQLHGRRGPAFTAPKGVWTEFRYTTDATAEAYPADTGLFVDTPGHLAGDEWDVDAVLLVEGTYAGPYFDGDAPDPSSTERYEWTGTPHASTSIYQQAALIEQPPTWVPDYEDPEGAWQATVDDLVRSLHNVTCISGPLIEQKLHSRSLWGYIVEFTLAAGTPWLFGLTKPVVIPPSLPVIVQDVPFNLMPYPSAELSSGTVVVARNLSPNPSVEVNANSWQAWFSVVSGTSPAAFLTSGRSTELAAGGSTASFRQRLLGNNGATAVTNAESIIAATEIVPLGAYPAGTRFSFSMWGAVLVVAGASGSTIVNLGGRVEWRNASDVAVGSVDLGTTTDPAEFGGRVFSAKSQAPPAGATQVHIYILATVRWSSSATAANNSDIRLYADTVAVTIP